MPQLSTVQESEVVQWLDICHEKNAFFKESHRRVAKTEIENFYKKHPKGVSMEKLAQKLQTILENVTRRFLT